MGLMLQTSKQTTLLFSQSVMLVFSTTTPPITQRSSRKLTQRKNNLLALFLVTICKIKNSLSNYPEAIIETYKSYSKVQRKFKLQTPLIDKESSLQTKDVIWINSVKIHLNHKSHLRNRRVINLRLYSMLLNSLHRHPNPIIKQVPIIFKANNKKSNSSLRIKESIQSPNFSQMSRTLLCKLGKIKVR